MGKGSRNRAFRESHPKPVPKWNPTPAERDAMNIEINRQILENDAAFEDDTDACILWALHTLFGFGPKRLRRFYDGFKEKHDQLRAYYELPPDENGWICRKMLKEKGVDVAAWNKESRK